MKKEERKSTVSRCFYEDCSGSIYKKTLICYRHWYQYIKGLSIDGYIDMNEYDHMLKTGRSLYNVPR